MQLGGGRFSVKRTWLIIRNFENNPQKKLEYSFLDVANERNIYYTNRNKMWVFMQKHNSFTGGKLIYPSFVTSSLFILDLRIWFDPIKRTRQVMYHATFQANENKKYPNYRLFSLVSFKSAKLNWTWSWQFSNFINNLKAPGRV